MPGLSDFVAVDVETTGLDFETECIIELAAVRFTDGKEGESFQALFTPAKTLTAMARLLTGFDESEFAGAPMAGESLRAFLAFAGDSPLVAHNADFDATFIRRALEKEKLAPPGGTWLDSLLIARTAWPEWENHKLENLAIRLQLPPENSHRALPDARRAGLVFLAAQKIIIASAPGLRRTLTSLAAELPGWNHVFAFPKVAEAPPEREFSGGETLILSRTHSPLPEISQANESEAAEAAQKLAAGEWLAWETSSAADDGLLGLQTARGLAALGKRVLIAAPDTSSWESLRRAAMAFGSGGPSHAEILEPQAYLCAGRVQKASEVPLSRLAPAERTAAIPLSAWADRTGSGLISECRGFARERTRLLWAKVRCDVYTEDPHAKAARVRAEGAEIVITTQAALCAHLKLEGALLPLFDALIITGAHKFQDVMQRALGREVSFFRLRQILQRMRYSPEEAFGLWTELETALGSAEGLGPEVWDHWKNGWFEPEREFHRFLNKLGRTAKRGESKESRLRYTEPLSLAYGADPEPVITALRKGEAFLSRCMESLPESSIPGSLRGEVYRIAEGLKDFRLDFEGLCEAKGEDVFILEDYTNPHKTALRSIPINGICGDKIQSLFEATAFLSPAMTVGRGDDAADFFLQGLGVSLNPESPRVRLRMQEHGKPSLKFLLAPTVPVSATVDSAPEFARLLWDSIFPFIRQGVFVLIPWPGTLRAVHKALRAMIPPDVSFWSQHVDGPRDALRQLYASRSGGLILATEGMDELQDRDGKAPALVVVARMPSPLFHDPVLEALSEKQPEDSSAGKKLWQQAGVLRLKRELTVLRRSALPKAIWLLDAKACREGSGALAARSLGYDSVTTSNSGELRTETEKALSV